MTKPVEKTEKNKSNKKKIKTPKMVDQIINGKIKSCQSKYEMSLHHETAINLQFMAEYYADQFRITGDPDLAYHSAVCSLSSNAPFEKGIREWILFGLLELRYYSDKKVGIHLEQWLKLSLQGGGSTVFSQSNTKTNYLKITVAVESIITRIESENKKRNKPLNKTAICYDAYYEVSELTKKDMIPGVEYMKPSGIKKAHEEHMKSRKIYESTKNCAFFAYVTNRFSGILSRVK